MSEPEPDAFDSTDFVQAVESFLHRFPGRDREGMTAWLADHPGMEDVLRSLAPAVEALEAVSESSSASPAIPEVLGDFRIGRELGRGGMGVVYEATQISLDRKVALKVMTGARFVDSEQRGRFHREAGVASRIQHPAMCTIHGYGVDEGVPYIAMSLVRGRTLSRIIDDGSGVISDEETYSTALDVPGSESTLHLDDLHTETVEDEPRRPPPRRAEVLRRIALIAEVARGIQVAHEAGIIHRDIKPGNIMVTPEGRPVVLDFGLARDETPDAVSLTRTGDVFGTPAYMAPEQIEPHGRRIDHRLDVHALGVTLFELVTAQRPFDAPTRAALLQKIVSEPAPNASRINPQVPRDAAVILETALDKDPDRRYRSALAFAEDLENVLAHRPVQARPVTLTRRLQRWVRRQPAVAALVALAFIAMVAAASVTTWYFATRDVIRTGEEERTRREVDRLLEDGYTLMADDPARALPVFREALELDPAAIAVRAGVAWSLIEMGADSEALAILDESPGLLLREPALRNLRANALKNLGRGEEAAQERDRLTAPRRAFDYFVLGMSQLHAASEGSREAARKAHGYFTESILRSDRPRAIYHHMRLRAAGYTGDYSVVNEAAGPVITRWPQDARAWYWIGRAAHLAGNSESSKTALSRAVEKAPGVSLYQAALSDTLRKRGELDEALAAARQAVADDPGSGLAELAMGKVLAVRGDFETSVGHYERALHLTPGIRSARVDLAKVLFFKLGQPQRARALLQKVVDSGDRDPQVHYVNAAIASSEGDLKSAVAALQRFLELRPDDAAGHRALGGTLMELGEHEKALVHLERAVELDPEDEEFKRTLRSVRREIEREADR